MPRMEMKLDVGKLGCPSNFGVCEGMKLKVYLFSFCLSLTLILTACSSDEEQTPTDEPTPTATALVQETPSTPTPDPLAILNEDAPMAVISTRSLRVRNEPSDKAKVIGSVRQHERYALLAFSADGKYLQLEIEQMPGGTGWVDTSFVTIQGDVTNIERGVIAKSDLPTATPRSTPPDTTATPSRDKNTPSDGRNATVTTNGQRLRIHKEPNTTSPISGRVNDGDTVLVVETSQDGKWLKIAAGGKDNPDGGWVAKEFLKFE